MLQMAADVVAQRRLTAATAERRPEVVHMYGTSLLSAPECLDYFKRYEPTSVECIDENSCKSHIVMAQTLPCIEPSLLGKNAIIGVALQHKLNRTLSITRPAMLLCQTM